MAELGTNGKERKRCFSRLSYELWNLCVVRMIWVYVCGGCVCGSGVTIYVFVFVFVTRDNFSNRFTAGNTYHVQSERCQNRRVAIESGRIVRFVNFTRVSGTMASTILLNGLCSTVLKVNKLQFQNFHWMANDTGNFSPVIRSMFLLFCWLCLCVDCNVFFFLRFECYSREHQRAFSIRVYGMWMTNKIDQFISIGNQSTNGFVWKNSKKWSCPISKRNMKSYQRRRWSENLRREAFHMHGTPPFPLI